MIMNNSELIKHRCCFAGNSEILDDDIKRKISESSENLILNYGVKEFWVGNYGMFDAYAASVIHDLKSKYPFIKLELVVPYLTKGISDYEQLYRNKFDNILLSNVPLTTPMRLRILKTNEYMVDKSSFLIAYVKYTSGGAAKTLGYAEKKNHIAIKNLALL